MPSRQVFHAVNDPDASSAFSRERSDLSRFWKEAVVEGKYVHPQNGELIAIDRARMERWAARFAAMKDDGVTVPIPYGHRNLFNCKEHAGTVIGAEVRQRSDGRFSYWMLCDIPREEDASKIGTTIKGCSVGINYDYTTANSDGTTRKWGEVVDHLALTNQPVIHQTEGFVPVEEASVPAAALSDTRGRRVIPDGDLAVCVTHLSREKPELAISDKPFEGGGKLPASCHLYVGNPSLRATWRLPVYEGSGALAEGVFSARGPLNRTALFAAENEVVKSADIPADDRPAVAKHLAQLLMSAGSEPSVQLLAAAGLSVGWLSESPLAPSDGKDPIPTMRRVISENLRREATWKVSGAFTEVASRIIGDSDLSAKEKADRLSDLVGEFRDLFADSETVVIREVVQALGVETSDVRDATQGGEPPAPQEADEMKLAEVIGKVKPLATRLGMELKDEATEADIFAVLDAAPGKFPEPKAEPPAETEREKSLRLELEAFRAEKRMGEVRTAQATADGLMKRGAISKRQHEILSTLLTAGPVKVALLSAEGEGDQRKESLTEKDAAVGALLLEFAKEIPDGAFVGRRTSPVTNPADEKVTKDEIKAAADRLMERAGRDPATGLPGRKAKTATK